jgi:hypothetical protein
MVCHHRGHEGHEGRERGDFAIAHSQRAGCFRGQQQKTFSEERAAVVDLLKITTDPAAVAAAEAISAMLAAAEIASRRPDKAIGHFREAWQHATRP